MKNIVKSEKHLQEDLFDAAVTSTVLKFPNTEGVTQYLVLLV